MTLEQIDSLSHKRRVANLTPARPWVEIDILAEIAESCNLWGSDVYSDVEELAAEINKRLKRKNHV
jgi:hypothetical protein